MKRPFERPSRPQLGRAVPVDQPSPPDAPDPLDARPIDGELMGPIGDGIPPHVWAILQEAGELAATRLRELLASPTFKTFSPNAQRGLIELALTRAYGLPVRKAVNVNLSSSDADAVAQSLADMAANLPEHESLARAARQSGQE